MSRRAKSKTQLLDRPWLIQTGVVYPEPEPDCTFIKSVSWNYMGSSEFEFGALPKSAKEMCKRMGDYAIVDDESLKNRLGHTLHIYLPMSVGDNNSHDTLAEYLTYLVDLKDMNLLTKERHEFDMAFKEELCGLSDLHLSHMVWWDIDNHIVFSYDGEFMKQIRTLLKRSEKALKESGNW